MIPQYKPEYTEEEAKALYDLVMSGSFLADFKKTEEFENKISEITKNKYCHAVNNGTIAITLALLARELKSISVIVPNLTMVATATAVQLAGKIPVFCDIEADTLCLDADKAIAIAEEQSIGAIIYVTLNGRMNVEGIQKIKKYCTEKNILLIKDDAQSLGSISEEILPMQDPKYADITTLSFSPHKLISCGQGGMILTNDEELGKSIARLKDFGRLEGGADIHDYFGINSKFTEMQATVGLVQFNRLLKRIFAKRRIYRRYYDQLDGMMLAPKDETPWFVDIYLSSNRLRDGLCTYLKTKNIGSRPVYPMLTSQKIYSQEEPKLYPVSKNFSETGLWLPSSFELKDEEIDMICGYVKGFLF